MNFKNQTINQNQTNKTIKGFFTLLVFTFLLFGTSWKARAATITSTSTGGAWATTTTWVGGVVPATSDVVIIVGSVTLPTTALTQTGSVTIGDAGTLTWSSGNVSYTFGGFTINTNGSATFPRPTTFTGNVEITGEITFSSSSGTGRAMVFSGNITLNSGAVWTEPATGNGSANTYSFAGNFINNATTFNALGTGLHTFSGTGKAISGSTNASFPSLEITGTITNNRTISATTALSGTGTLTNSSTGTLNIGGTCSVTTLTNQGTINRSGTGTTTTILANFTNTGTINISGSGNITGITNNANGIVNHSGSSTISSFNNATSLSTLNISTTPTVPTFTNLTVTAAGNTVNYNGAGSQTVKAVAYSNLTLSSSGVKSLLNNTSVTAKMSIAPTGTATASIATGVNLRIRSLFFVGTNQVIGTWGYSGKTNNNTTYFANTTGFLTVAASSPITSVAAGGAWATTGTWVGGVVPLTNDDVVIANTSSSVSLGANAACANLTINNSSTLTIGAFTFAASGSTTIGSGTSGTLTITSTTGTKTFSGAVTINSGGLFSETVAEAITFGNDVTIDGTLTESGNAVIGVAGNLTKNGTYTASSGVHTFSGTSKTIGGSSITTISSVAITGTITNSGTLTVGTALTGVGTLVNTGTLNIGGTSTISNLTATAIGNTVNFTGAAQTIKVTPYYNLGLSGTLAKTLGAITTISGNLTLSGAATATTGAALTIGGNLTVGTGTTLATGATNTWTLGVTGTTDLTGTLTLANTATKIFTGDVTLNAGATWNETGIATFNFTGNLTNYANTFTSTGTHNFIGSTAQTITGVTTFNNLTINNALGIIANNNITVNGILTLTSANVSATAGALDMGVNTLNMGSAATTAGTGDVTGMVKRSTIAATTDYSFGNQFTVLNFSNTGTLPTDVTVKIVLTTNHLWKSEAIHRYYDIIRTGGDISNKVAVQLHYLASELNGVLENSNIDFFDYHVSNASGHDHGHNSENTTDKWIGKSGLSLTYIFPTVFGDKYWTLAQSIMPNYTWIGAISTDWTLADNWSTGVPIATSDVVIPDATTTSFDPTLPSSTTVNSISLASGSVLNGGTTTTLTLAASSGSAWMSDNATFNYGTSNLIFTGTTPTIGGTTTFYNVTINNGASLTLGTDNVMRIAGTLTNNGTLNAASNHNTVEYNGSGPQTIVNPNGLTTGYHNLILSGAGTKTLPASTLNIAGEFTNNGTMANGAGTVTFSGTTAQTITGANTFNNVTLNNATGLLLANNTTISGTLTLTSGKFSIGANTLTLGGAVSGSTATNSFTGSSMSNIVSSGTTGNIYFDQTTAGTTNLLKNLTINGNTTSLANTLNITKGATPGIVIVNSGTLVSGGFLTLKSDANGTASIGTSAGTITGNVNVERYVSGQGRKWRFFSSPVSGASIANWMNQFYVTGPGTGTVLGDPNSNGWHTSNANIINALVSTTSIRTLCLIVKTTA
ncbi:MAG: beta strand repeat-containing protein [Bacteroidia bacterium]